MAKISTAQRLAPEYLAQLEAKYRELPWQEARGAAAGRFVFDGVAGWLPPKGLVFVSGEDAACVRAFLAWVSMQLAYGRHKGGYVFLSAANTASFCAMALSAISGLPHQRLEAGRLRRADWPGLTRAAAMLASCRLTLSEEPPPVFGGIAGVIDRRGDTDTTLDFLVADSIAGLRQPKNRLRQLSRLAGERGITILLGAEPAELDEAALPAGALRLLIVAEPSFGGTERRLTALMPGVKKRLWAEAGYIAGGVPVGEGCPRQSRQQQWTFGFMDAGRGAPGD